MCFDFGFIGFSYFLFCGEIGLGILFFEIVDAYMAYVFVIFTRVAYLINFNCIFLFFGVIFFVFNKIVIVFKVVFNFMFVMFE